MKGFTMSKDTFKELFEAILLIAATDGVAVAEDLVYDNNAVGILPDPEALFILRRLNA
jgi:hypothetical protein